MAPSRRNGKTSPKGFSAASVLTNLLLAVLLAGTTAAQSVLAGPERIIRYGMAGAAAPLPEGSWRFIVSGDSRNCGDIVMPAIAAQSARFKPSFYWHLGDLRAVYKIDEDMAFAATNNGQFLSCSLYLPRAWPDFIDRQIAPFGNLPFYVGIGNHEIIPPKDKLQFRRQFAAWLDQPTLHAQRAADEEAKAALEKSEKNNKKRTGSGPAEPPAPQTYYHWVQNSVDFIYLDNASDCFPQSQLDWLAGILQRDAAADSKVRSIVVGMHEALPDSIANNHSMGDSPVDTAKSSGEAAYDALLRFRDQTHRPVYVLSSHSHFYMENIFDTVDLKKKGDPLPGWIVGTGGAERYKLPVPAPPNAQKDVYGYLLGTVAADGTIEFAFQEIRESDLPAPVRREYPQPLVQWCFAHNSQNTYPGAGEITPHCAASPPPAGSTPPKCE